MNNMSLKQLGKAITIEVNGAKITIAGGNDCIDLTNDDSTTVAKTNPQNNTRSKTKQQDDEDNDDDIDFQPRIKNQPTIKNIESQTFTLSPKLKSSSAGSMNEKALSVKEIKTGVDYYDNAIDELDQEMKKLKKKRDEFKKKMEEMISNSEQSTESKKKKSKEDILKSNKQDNKKTIKKYKSSSKDKEEKKKTGEPKESNKKKLDTHEKKKKESDKEDRKNKKKTEKKPQGLDFAKIKSTNKYITEIHLKELRENGFTVINNVLTQEEIVQGHDLILDFINDNGKAHGITKFNYYTDEEKFSKVFDNINGIIRYPPAGHTPYATFIRTSLGVSSVFSELWGCENKDLITSFDRIQIGIPKMQPGGAIGAVVLPEENQQNDNMSDDDETKSIDHDETMLNDVIPDLNNNAEEPVVANTNTNTNSSNTTSIKKKKRKTTTRTIPSWTHTDQDDRSHNLECIQGYVSLTDVGSNSGSFFALKGSHLKHEKILKKIAKFLKKGKKEFKGFSGNWVKLPKDFDEYIINKCGCEPSYARPISAGSIVLWDSRLFHANVPQTPTEDIVSEDVYNFTVESPPPSMKYLTRGPSNKVPRLGSYVCMLPRKLVENAKRHQIQRRQKAFLDSRTTSHWPTAMVLFPDSVTFRGKVDKNNEYDEKYIKPNLRLAESLKIINSRGEDRYEEIVRNMGFESPESFVAALQEKFKNVS